MQLRLPKDLLTETYIRPRLFLCETDKTKICELDVIDMSGNFKFNAYSELTFTVPRTYTNMITGETDVNLFYDKIEALRLVYLEDFGYFEIQTPEIVGTGMREAKNITAYSLEYNLSQKYLENMYVNTGETNDIGVDISGKITRIPLYNPANKKFSLLHLILEKTYNWTIGHVDSSLQNMYRSFEVSRASVYDFITQDLCEKFNCFAVFDTINNTINLYAESLIYKATGDGISTAFTIYPAYNEIEFVSVDSYKTTEYTYDNKTGELTFYNAPENGAIIEVVDADQKQWRTDVYVSFENLAQEVNISYNADDIKTVLTVKGANDLDILEVNMGLSYIVNLSYYHTVEWMGQELYSAYDEYQKHMNDSQSIFMNNAKEILMLDGYIDYEEGRLSLQYSIADNVTMLTTGTYYVRGGTSPNYYYTEVTLPNDYSANVEHYYSLSGTDLNKDKVSDLYAAMQSYYTNGSTADISKLSDSFAFMESYTVNDLINDITGKSEIAVKDAAFNRFLDEMWNQVGKRELINYQTIYNKNKETNTEAGWNDESNDNYWKYYPVEILLDTIQTAIDKRDELINQYTTIKEGLEKANTEIAKNASMENCFVNYYLNNGESPDVAKDKANKLLVRLSTFLREDEYTDDNFVETESDTIETVMKLKNELRECGKIELAKLCEPKLEFSMEMANIYALHEFEPIVDQFQLGKLINIEMRPKTAFEPAYIKQARLLAVNINFDDFSDFSCEFGELMNLRTPSSIHADLLSTALSAGKSVASNESKWNQNIEKISKLALQVEEGLNNAVIAVTENDGTQNINTTQYGIRLQKRDGTGNLDPKEGWIINNQFLYSDDNFKTAKSVFGEYIIDGQIHWGLVAEAVMAGYIAGCTIEGGKINIGDGAFIVNEDGTVTMNAKSNSIVGYAKTQSVEVVEAQINNIIDSQINNNSSTIVSSHEPENASYNQLWLDTSFMPSRLKIFVQVENQEYGEWINCTDSLGQGVYTSKPTEYLAGDLWILSAGETCGSFGAGSMLKAVVSSKTFDASHWVDADEEYTKLKNNIQQYFGFDPNTGLRIGQTDNKFYVNISSSEMGFYDNSEGQNQKVVSIGNNAATIKDLTVEDDAEFNCNATFNKQIQFGNFVWQIESNGSLSLAVAN